MDNPYEGVNEFYERLTEFVDNEKKFTVDTAKTEY